MTKPEPGAKPLRGAGRLEPSYLELEIAATEAMNSAGSGDGVTAEAADSPETQGTETQGTEEGSGDREI